MDDADLRRGNAALHLVYGEEVALLAAIALLNQAYALFGETPELIREAAECIGLGGMIGGQAIDLRRDCGEASLEERDHKTSALTRLALTAGALAAGASSKQVAPLAIAGQRLGRAYQICDDLLDVAPPHQLTGKTAKQDVRHNRPSHASGAGRERRYEEMERLLAEAHQSLVEGFGTGTEVTLLTGFIDKVFDLHAQALRQAC
jgi:geranylgeranyl pyrophosphate synthase